MLVFANKDRADSRTKRSTESDFDFIDRCSWPEMNNVRDLLNSCVGRYPVGEQAEMVARLRDRRHFSDAVFELLIHDALLRLGFDAHPHPTMPNGTKVDFLVTCPSGERVYLEAVLTSERGRIDPGAQARIDAAIDYLSSRPHANFFAEIVFKGAPATPPSGKLLAREIHKFFDGLNPDVIADDMANGRPRPSLHWSHEGWFVKIKPIAVKPERRGETTTLVGMLVPEAGWSDSWTPMRDAVSHKGAKYGDPDLPLLIATNFESVFLDQFDELQALYGQEQFVFSVADLDAEPRRQRARNGAWIGSKGPRGRRVSGVWSFKGLNAYNVATCKQAIYLHPWAHRPLPKDALRFPHFELRGDELVGVGGITLKEIFGLPDGWPEVASAQG